MADPDLFEPSRLRRNITTPMTTTAHKEPTTMPMMALDERLLAGLEGAAVVVVSGAVVVECAGAGVGAGVGGVGAGVGGVGAGVGEGVGAGVGGVGPGVHTGTVEIV